MTKLNVGLYSPSLYANDNVHYKNGWIMVNPTPFYLHGYFRKNYSEYAENVKWYPCIIFHKSTQELAQYCVKHQLDFFCISLYIWNLYDVLDVVRPLKEELQRIGYTKQIKIVAGGPSCDAVKDDWENKYPYIDHFVVGQGEKAWANLILDALGVRDISTDGSTNIVFLKNNEIQTTKKYDYEFVRGIHYSPYLECKDLVVEILEEYKDIRKNLGWLYETQRGCPYHCTFCDWNGGQSNKTQKRNHVNFLDEIDFFIENQLYNIYIGDANFGMWDVDVQIMERICEHKRNGHPIKFYTYSLNKKITENHKKIMNLLVEHKLYDTWVKFSAQDVHEDILKIIDRPGNWPETKAFATELYDTYRNKKRMGKIWIELIMGLPGQTVESWRKSLNEIYYNGFYARTYPCIVLPNAPLSYDLEYRKKYQIYDEIIFEVLDSVTKGTTVEEIYSRPNENFRYRMITSTFSFSSSDWIKMTMLSQLYKNIFFSKNFSSYYDGIIHIIDAVDRIITFMINSDEFNMLHKQRYSNFEKYKVNAANSVKNTVMLEGNDMAALIGIHYNTVEEIVNNEISDKKIADLLLTHLSSYRDLADLIREN